MSKKLADELDAQKGDESRWKKQPVAIEVQPSASESQVVSFRMPAAEFEELVEAAVSAGESTSKYIRGAIKLRQIASPLVNMMQISGDLSRWSRTETAGNENPVGDSEVEPFRSVSI